MDPQLPSMFVCPLCRNGDLVWQSDTLFCESCEAGWATDRYIDFFDAATNEVPPSSWQQTFRRSELIARVYDKWFWPTWTRFLGGQSAVSEFAGEFFLIKNCLGLGERLGPWLDLSCSSGMFTRAIAAADPNSLVVGVDASRPMLETAAGRLKGYENVVLAYATHSGLPLATNTFGGVNDANGIHSYTDPESVFLEILRVLQPQGVFVGAVYAPSSSWTRKTAAKLAGVRQLTGSHLEGWLSRLGFIDFESIRLADTVIFRCRKP